MTHTHSRMFVLAPDVSRTTSREQLEHLLGHLFTQMNQAQIPRVTQLVWLTIQC